MPMKPLALDSTLENVKAKMQLISNALTPTTQSDFEESDEHSDAYMKNKPTGIWGDRTITGNPLSFQKRKAEPANKTLISMSPIQDLHGYDYPWPAGGGKNILAMTVDGIKSFNTDGTWSGNTYTLNDVTFTIQLDESNNIIGILVNGTASANTNFIIGTSPLDITSILNGCPAGDSTSSYLLRAYHALDGISGINKDDIGNGSVAYTPIRNDYDVRIVIYSNYAANNLLFKPMVRLSTETDSSFSPYSNICPISGRTQASLDGCGKNLFDKTNSSEILDLYFNRDEIKTSTYVVKLVFVKCKPNTTYTVSKQRGERFAVAYTKEIPNESIAVFGYTAFNNYTSITITTGEDAKYLVAYIYHGNYDSITPEQMISSVQIEEDSEATTYEPYQQSNEITISFPALGKNLFSGEVYQANSNLNKDTGEIVADGNYDVYLLPTLAVGTYNLSVLDSSSVTSVQKRVASYDSDDNLVGEVYSGGHAPSTTERKRIAFSVPSGASYTICAVRKTSYDVMVESGSTATAYEPYTNTVYGGTLDVEKGELVVDKGYVDLGTLDWIKESAPYKVFRVQFNDAKFLGELVCSEYKGIKVASISYLQNGDISATNAQILVLLRIRDDAKYDVMDATAFKTAMSGVQLVYELDTPRTIQLTPEQVQLLKGHNTIWTDGDSISLTYKDDAKNITDVATDLNYISTDMAPNESTISTAAYQVGDYLILNNNFYKVTAPISIGDTIAVGTNVTRTTIGAELSLLHS